MKPVGGAKAWGGFPGYVGLFEDNHEWSKGRTQGRWSDPPLDPSDRSTRRERPRLSLFLWIHDSIFSDSEDVGVCGGFGVKGDGGEEVGVSARMSSEFIWLLTFQRSYSGRLCGWNSWNNSTLSSKLGRNEEGFKTPHSLKTKHLETRFLD